MTGLQKLVDAAVAAAQEKFATLKLRADELAVTLVDLRDLKNPTRRIIAAMRRFIPPAW